MNGNAGCEARNARPLAADCRSQPTRSDSGAVTGGIVARGLGGLVELVGKPVTRVVLEGRSWYPDNGKLYGELALGEFGGIIVLGD